MIMVANKRDKDQMKKELQLFLGSHTGEIELVQNVNEKIF